MTFDRRLISAVMTRDVCRIGEERAALDALARMRERGVSSLLVMKDDLVLGIITEADVVRAMHRAGDLGSLGCVDLMHAPVISVPATARCLEAYHLMTARGIRHLAVTDENGQLVGVASEGDVMRNFGHEYYMTFKEVGDVMSREFCRLPPTATLADALSDMVEKHQSCVVVVDAEHRAAGVLTERDIVALSSARADPEQITLEAAMHAPVKTVRPGERLHDAVKAMEQAHIRRLVVVDERLQVCGLLTHHEVARGLEGDYVAYLRELVDLQGREMENPAQAIDERLLLANILRSVNGTAVLASDLEFRIAYATPAVDRVLGLSATGVGGMDIRHALGEVGWTRAEAALREVAVAQRPRHYLVATPRGELDLQLSVLFDAQFRAQGYLVLAQKA